MVGSETCSLAEPVAPEQMKQFIQNALHQLRRMSDEFAYIQEDLQRALVLKTAAEDGEMVFETVYHSNSWFKCAADLSDKISQLRVDLQRILS